MSAGEALHGCIPILVTPFVADGALDLNSLERQIEWVLAEGASGVACVAIASEAATGSSQRRPTSWLYAMCHTHRTLRPRAARATTRRLAQAVPRCPARNAVG